MRMCDTVTWGMRIRNRWMIVRLRGMILRLWCWMVRWLWWWVILWFWCWMIHWLGWVVIWLWLLIGGMNSKYFLQSCPVSRFGIARCWVIVDFHWLVRWLGWHKVVINGMVVVVVTVVHHVRHVWIFLHVIFWHPNAKNSLQTERMTGHLRHGGNVVSSRMGVVRDIGTCSGSMIRWLRLVVLRCRWVVVWLRWMIIWLRWMIIWLRWMIIWLGWVIIWLRCMICWLRRVISWLRRVISWLRCMIIWLGWMIIWLRWMIIWLRWVIIWFRCMICWFRCMISVLDTKYILQ